MSGVSSLELVQRIQECKEVASTRCREKGNEADAWATHCMQWNVLWIVFTVGGKGRSRVGDGITAWIWEGSGETAFHSLLECEERIAAK